MTGPVLLLSAAFGVGVLMAVYLPVQAQLGRAIGSPLAANIPFFVVGLVASIVLAGAAGRLRALSRLPEAPPWALAAGIGAAAMIIGSTALIPRIGAQQYFVLLVAGQLLTGALIAQTGAFGSARLPVTPVNLAGIALVVAGAWLATRR